MAGASLIFRYQWLAFWRRALRTGRIKAYLTTLTLLGWLAAVALRDSVPRAAGELDAGQTASMDRLLLALCLLWLVVPGEDLKLSLSSDRLRRFPLDARSLLALRLSSLFLSPIAWVATIVSLVGLVPLRSAGHPVLGSLAALLLFALALGAGLSVSQLRGMARWITWLLVVVAAAIALALRAHPASLVTAVAVAITPYAIVVPAATLLASTGAVWFLFVWGYRRSLHADTSERTARRATSIARLPGRLGPLVQKEQRSLRRVLDLWISLLVVLLAAAALLSVPASLSSTFRRIVFWLVCAMNIKVTTNCLGLDRPAGLTRYLVLPIRGRDLFLAKNVAMMIVVAGQLMLLLAIGAWQSGFSQLGEEIVVVTLLILAHLAWGNVVSVFEPRRTEPRRFTSDGDVVTAILSLVVGSAPGLTVVVLLRYDSGIAPLAIAAIVLLTVAAYYGSLQYAGRAFERRIELISRRLA